ncbi:unnamed protein product [Sympodiomycopsis kandeliae]
MSSGPKYTLHHLEASRSLRVSWLLEYLEIPYKLEIYSRDPKTRWAQGGAGSGQGLAAIHPLGRSPVLEVEDAGEKFVIAETGAILTYLLEHHPKNGQPKPSDKNQRAQDLNFWIQFGESSIFLHSVPFMYGLRGKVLTDDASGAFEQSSTRGLKADLDHIENVLKQNNGTLQGGSVIGPADIVTSVSVMFTSMLWSQQTPEFWSKLELGLGTETKKWLALCTQDKYYKIATQKEVQAGGKIDNSEDWLKALSGWLPSNKSG